MPRKKKTKFIAVKTKKHGVIYINKERIRELLKSEKVKKKLRGFLLSLKTYELRLNYIVKRRLKKGILPMRIDFYLRFVKKYPSFWKNLLKLYEKEKLQKKTYDTSNQNCLSTINENSNKTNNN